MAFQLKKTFLFCIVCSVLALAGCKGKKNLTGDTRSPRFEIEGEQETVKNDRKPTRKPEKEPSDPGNYEKIVKKYAAELGIGAQEIKTPALYQYIDSWIGVPYKWAGESKSGTDCSGFVMVVYRDVFNKKLQRSATEMVKECEPIEKAMLQEADLVFFDINGKNSHVGIYLANGRFIHASTSRGVIISDLSQSYYQKYWGRAGRVKTGS